MRDRLIEVMYKANEKFDEVDCTPNEAIEILADHLLENGVIVPPCKVGDKVFYVHEVCDENANEYLDISVGEVISFSMQKEGLWMYCRYEDGLTYWHVVTDEFGVTVFLTREDAEAKLKEGGRDEGLVNTKER